MFVCFWFRVIVLGNGSVFKIRFLFVEFVLKIYFLVRNEIIYFLGVKKFLFVFVSGERRDTILRLLVCGNLGAIVNSCFYVVLLSKVKWFIYLCSIRSVIVWIYICFIVRDSFVLGWSIVDFLFIDISIMDGSVFF